MSRETSSFRVNALASPDPLLYMDNAATSFPKAPGVARAVYDYLTSIGASAGRGGHILARKADAILWETRELVASLLGAPDPKGVIFTMNVTQALNVALFGLLREGDHVVTTSMEHNSVMRPLKHLEKTRGIRISIAKGDQRGIIRAQDVVGLIQENTRLVVMNHASNVTGGLLPIREVAKEKGPALMLVDAAQTAGSVPMDMSQWGIDLVAFTGHKSLLGPTGVGGLCIGPGVEIPPMILGGTGTRSESHDHPLELPLGLEAGTHNMAGIAGLRASLQYLKEVGVDSIRAREESLMDQFLKALSELPAVHTYGPGDARCMVPVVSINIPGMHPTHLASVLEEGFGILVRAGLHCSPSAHQTINTFPDGTVRISFGPFGTENQLLRVIEALKEISQEFVS